MVLNCNIRMHLFQTKGDEHRHRMNEASKYLIINIREGKNTADTSNKGWKVFLPVLSTLWVVTLYIMGVMLNRLKGEG